MRYIAIALVMLATTAIARDDAGRWAQADPALRQWFRDQRSPLTGQSCCDEADGTEAEEDIRNGHYWARWKMKPRGFDQEFTTEWVEIPDEVVIREPNKNGAPIVWWWFEDGKPAARCYSPGGGV